MMKTTKPLTEARIIENFMGTIHGLTEGEALANAELDIRAYNMSRLGARNLGYRIRAHFSGRRLA
jgi:hypothetical protein